jgi:hypothetical protein
MAIAQQAGKRVTVVVEWVTENVKVKTLSGQRSVYRCRRTAGGNFEHGWLWLLLPAAGKSAAETRLGIKSRKTPAQAQKSSNRLNNLLIHKGKIMCKYLC